MQIPSEREYPQLTVLESWGLFPYQCNAQDSETAASPLKCDMQCTLSDPADVTCTAFFSNIDGNLTVQSPCTQEIMWSKRNTSQMANWIKESVCVSVSWSSTIWAASHQSCQSSICPCKVNGDSVHHRWQKASRNSHFINIFTAIVFTVGPFNDLSMSFQIVCFHPRRVSVNTIWDKCPTSLFSYVSSTLSVHNLCIYFQYSLCTCTSFLHIFRAIKSSTNVMQKLATMPESTHTAADFQVKGI